MKERTRFLPTILFCAALVAFWMFCIIPDIQRARVLPGRILDVQTQAQARTRAGGNFRREGEKTQELVREEFGELFKAAREAEHSEHMIREVRRLCAASGVKLITFQPQSPTVRGEFRRFPVQLNVEGNHKGMAQLFGELRDARPVIDAEQLTMRATTNSKTISAQLTIASFAWVRKDAAKRRTPGSSPQPL